MASQPKLYADQLPAPIYSLTLDLQHTEAAAQCRVRARYKGAPTPRPDDETERHYNLQAFLGYPPFSLIVLKQV